MSKIKISTIGFILIAIWIIYIFFNLKESERELEKHGIETVAKTTKFSGTKGGPTVDYIFVVNNKEYLGNSPRNKTPYEKVKRFYKLVYSEKNPEINKIYLEEEITDTSKIMKAGFKKQTKVRKYDSNGNFLFEKDTLYFRR